MRTQNITNIADFRANLSKYFDLVHETNEPIVVLRHGEDPVVLMSGKKYDSLQAQLPDHPFFALSLEERKARFDAMTKRIREYWGGKNKDLKVTPEDVDKVALELFDHE